jgi:hypothetical protein
MKFKIFRRILWLVKEWLYRDASWEAPCTLFSACYLFIGMVVMFYTSPYLLITGQLNGFGHISEAQSMHDHVMSFPVPLLIAFLLCVAGKGFAYINSYGKGEFFFDHSGCQSEVYMCWHVSSKLFHTE